MRRDLPLLRTLGPAQLRFSFGALRQHFAANALCEDVRAWIDSGEIAAAELELRIAEKVLSNLGAPGATLRALTRQGVSVVIDEFGRGVTSLPKLARLPVAALQLDRAMVLSARGDSVANKAVRAAIAIATALDLQPIASRRGRPVATRHNCWHSVARRDWATVLVHRRSRCPLAAPATAQKALNS